MSLAYNFECEECGARHGDEGCPKKPTYKITCSICKDVRENESGILACCGVCTVSEDVCYFCGPDGFCGNDHCPYSKSEE